MLPVRLFSLALTCLILAGAMGCGKPSNLTQQEDPSNVKIEPGLQADERSLLFDMVPSKDSSGLGRPTTYDCTYEARGRTARFRFQFVKGATVDDKFHVVKAEGKFLAVAASDDTVLLENLREVLDAKRLPRRTRKVSELAFDAVVLGQRQTRDASGTFSANPPGDWTATKIFLPKGGEKGEVFFNFNPVLGKAEFSIKDSDYGDYVLEALGKVL